MPFKTGLSNYWLCALYLNEDNALSICTGFPITTQRFLEISHGNRRFIPIRPDTNIIESLTTSEEADDLNTNENTKSTDTSYGKITTTLTETKDPSKGPTQDNCTSDYEDKSVSTCEIFLEKPNSKLYHYFKISRNRRLNLQIKLQKYKSQL
ncbi:MAG: hypothetical protein HWD59_11215 [Coxiellaceae bacterium]|nr:MAG: hypothetical protein HWD59_11215 [Coxiellaceae bacterium]